MKGSGKVAKVRSVSSENLKEMRPALTPEARENQLISLAVDLVEKRLREGTATSQETTHFLKLASKKSKLEEEKIALELEMIRAKTNAINSSENSEKLYSDAIKAFQKYSGNGTGEEDYD